MAPSWAYSVCWACHPLDSESGYAGIYCEWLFMSNLTPSGGYLIREYEDCGTDKESQGESVGEKELIIITTGLGLPLHIPSLQVDQKPHISNADVD